MTQKTIVPLKETYPITMITNNGFGVESNDVLYAGRYEQYL